MALTVELNGQRKTFEDLNQGSPLQDLIATLELKGDRIAVEQNGEIVPRDARQNVLLSDGDKIEIVHFVGGGALF